MTKTVAAIATAHGTASIAIVRLSGDDALKIACRITNTKRLTPRFAHLKTLLKENLTVIDEAIVIFFKAPKSFTGEDVVEFQCHGGIAVACILLDELIKLGATLAQPGEFSKRAFLNERIDLTQAQAIANLIETKNENAVELLARQMKGELKNFIELIRDELLLLIAHCEVNIDYAYEDLPLDLIDQIKNKLKDITKLLKKSLNASKQRMFLENGYKVAIIGRVNVGKSSLLNALLHFDRAIVTNIAGTTRDTIEESIKIGTHLVRIVDTAGIRKTNETIECIGIQKSLTTAREADILIAVFDGSQELKDEDYDIIKLIKKYKDKKSFIVINKSDLPQVISKKNLNLDQLLEISCKRDTQILINALKAYMNKSNVAQENILISKKQILAVTNAINEIDCAQESLSLNEIEILSFHLNEAISFITSITRPLKYDEVLDKMFANFCLGK